METAKPVWTPQQEKVIALYVEKFGMNRSNAIRKLRGQELRGITPANILAEAKEPKLKMVQVQEHAKAARKPKAEKKPKAPRKSKYAINMDADRVKKLFREHKTVSATAVALGYPKGHGNNRTYSALLKLGLVKARKSEK